MQCQTQYLGRIPGAPRRAKAHARLLWVLCSCAPAVAAGQTVWTSNKNGPWGDSKNWSAGTPTASTLAVFSSATGVGVSLDRDFAALGILFDSTAGAYTFNNPPLSTATLTLGANGILTNSATDQTITGGKLALVLSTASSFAVNGSGNLTISAKGGPIATTATNTLTLGGSGSGTGSITEVISGSGLVTKSGMGTWYIGGANTYTGGTTLTGGTLMATNGAALGATTSATTINAGATLGLSGNITLTSSSETAAGISASGTGADGSGAINNIAGANSYSGPLTVLGDVAVGATADTLTLGGAINLAAAAPGVSTLTLKPAAGAAINVTGAITDNASLYALNLAATGGGTVILSGANAYSGNTIVGTAGGVTTGTLRLGANGALPTRNSASMVTIYSGTLDLANFNATAYGGLTLGGGGTGSTAQVTTGTGVLTLNHDLVFDAANNPNGATFTGNLGLGGFAHQFTIGDSTSAADDLTISATVSDVSGSSLTKSGAGTLVLSGANTYSGATTVEAGVVKVRNNTALGSSTGGTTVNAGATVDFAGALTVGESFTLAGLGNGGNGALRNTSGSSTLTGGITLANSTARIQADAGTALNITTTNITSVGNSTLEIGGAGTVKIASGIASSGLNSVALTKKDGGTLTLTGSNTFGGPIDVQGGVLSVQHNNALGTTTTQVTVEANAALAFDSTANGNLNTAAGLTTINVNGSGVSGTGAIRNTAGTNTYNGTLNVASAATLTANAGTTLTLAGPVTSSNGSTLTIGTAAQNGSVTVAGALAGVNLTKNGAVSGGDGILTLTGGGTVGSVNLNQGRLAVQSNQLNTGDFTAAAGTSLLIAAGTTVAISGNTVFNSATLDGSAGTLQVGGNHSLTFNGTINASNLTLSLGGASAGNGSAPLTVFLAGANVTVGTIVITGDTILDFGNSAGTVLSSGALMFTNPNAKVQVVNWTSTENNALLSSVWYATSTIGNITLGLTNQTPASNPMLGQISFQDGRTTTWVEDTSRGWFDHEIRPTPEPTMYGALFLSGCAGILAWRRRHHNRHRAA